MVITGRGVRALPLPSLVGRAFRHFFAQFATIS
jgi:hypothetical protein